MCASPLVRVSRCEQRARRRSNSAHGTDISSRVLPTAGVKRSFAARAESLRAPWTWDMTFSGP